MRQLLINTILVGKKLLTNFSPCCSHELVADFYENQLRLMRLPLEILYLNILFMCLRYEHSDRENLQICLPSLIKNAKKVKDRCLTNSNNSLSESCRIWEK